MRSVGPHSRRDLLTQLDRRSHEARLLRAFRQELTAHVGGAPTATQRVLIDRAAVLQLRLALMDRASLTTPGMTEKNGREYVCWTNALTRVLNALGPAVKASEAPPDLRTHLARKAAVIAGSRAA